MPKTRASKKQQQKPLTLFKTQELYSTRIKRYRYLLGQTDLFAHFLKLKDVQDDVIKTVLEERGLVKKRSKKRRRKTEKEEDEEMLNKEQENDHESTIFSQSPKCKHQWPLDSN